MAVVEGQLHKTKHTSDDRTGWGEISGVGTSREKKWPKETRR